MSIGISIFVLLTTFYSSAFVSPLLPNVRMALVQDIVPIIKRLMGLPLGDPQLLTGLAKWTEMADRWVVCVV